MDLLGTPSYALNLPAIHQVLWRAKMITEEKVWGVIDQIAKDKGVSLNALAKLSGLDGGSLRKSQRIKPYGVLRYPRIQTIQSVLNTAGVSFVEFAKMVEENEKN